MGSGTTERLARLALVAAVLLFLGLGAWQSRTFMVWSEEVMVHAMPAARVLEPRPDASGAPRVERSCAGPDAPVLVHSASRPTLVLCAGGRSWPVMIAPYLSGWLYWPFALFAPLHHDDVFALRLFGMVLGVLSLLVTFAVVRRLAGPGVAAATALVTAVMPSFLVVHATLEHFEGLPWTLTMASAWCFSRCPGLRVPGDALPTRRLVLGALFSGLALAASLKAAVLLAVFGGLALRLGVSVRPVSRRQWAAMALALVVPVLPMLALALAPDVGYSDKGSGALRVLAAHLTDPSWLGTSLRGLVLFWADIAYYFAGIVQAPRPHLVAIAVASASALFVVVDAVRTVVRGRGAPVEAACGLALLAYVLMVGLLYDHFPSNFVPLHTVFAAATATAATRLAGVFARWAPPRAASIGFVVAALLPFARSSADTIDAMRDVVVHTNADAERALVRALRARAEEHVPVFTADLMLAGVVDSLSRGEVRTLRAHELFSSCRPVVANRDAPACLERRWRAFLPFEVRRSARYVAPTDWARFGSGHLDYVPSLEAAARAGGYRVTLERTFANRRGTAVISLYRIDAPPRAP